MKRKASKSLPPAPQINEEEPEDKVKRFKQVSSFDRLHLIFQSYKNKQHTLVFCSRGINYRHRHLMMDLIALMPHSKTDVKFDDKHQLSTINEIADMKNCTNVIFFETRKKNDLYLWLAKTPMGPSVKFHLTNGTPCFFLILINHQSILWMNSISLGIV